MLPPISPSAQQFVDSINSIQNRMLNAEQQISSGRKVNQASDAPDQISPILQLHAEIQHNQDIQDGLNTAQTDLNSGEQALSSSVDLLQSAAVIATQATSPIQTADTRAALAQNVQGLLEQLVSNSRTTIQGHYVFSGDQDQTPLYDISGSTVTRLAVVSATRMVQAPSNEQFSAGLSANTIFDPRDANDQPVSGNAFQALTDLLTALQNNDSAGIAAAIPAVQAAGTYMNKQLAFYGQTQNRVTAALDLSKNYDVQLQSQLSTKTDADVTAAITSLTQAQTQMQAAMNVRARMPQTTLFDVLK